LTWILADQGWDVDLSIVGREGIGVEIRRLTPYLCIDPSIGFSFLALDYMNKGCTACTLEDIPPQLYMPKDISVRG
jgi:hypothetical protein